MRTVAFIGLLISLALAPVAAAACQTGEQIYVQGGTYNGISYTAVRVNWQEGSVYLRRSSDGRWVNAFAYTPSEYDPEVLEYIVENDILHREVSSEC